MKKKYEKEKRGEQWNLKLIKQKASQVKKLF